METAEMQTLPGNSVVYSDSAWAVARKASTGDDRWFPDSAAWRVHDTGLSSSELLAWAGDWVVLR